MHFLDNYTPPDRFGFKVDTPADDQETIVGRLVDYYQRLDAEATVRGVAGNADMWAHISRGHEEFRTALSARDYARVSEMLLHVATGPLVVGYMNYEPYDRLRDDAQARVREAKHFADKLLALSESLGCSPVQCVEQGAWGYTSIDFDSTIAAIERRIGFEIAPPRAGGGSFGLRMDSSVLCMKDLHAIYTSMRVRGVLAESSEKAVAEIGGGTGTLAYYLVKAGLRRVSVFDLPIVSILQGYYLMRSLGQNKVWLHGEPQSEAVARVRPHWALADEPDKSIDLFVNQDSLPEIELAAARSYIRLIHAKGRNFFLSINQEGQALDTFCLPQSVVYQLVEENGGFERSYRFPHWMRAGYVEELYRIC
jgi:putative sugar O-methyltransferase